MFLREVFLEYIAFWTINGYYRQKSGLSMGSRISLAISNIFLHMLESTIIQKYVDENIILFYCRYVDDCLLLVRKRNKNKILGEMNSFDSGLKFTETEMSENKLIFLDTKVVIVDDQLE